MGKRAGSVCKRWVGDVLGRAWSARSLEALPWNAFRPP